MRYLILAMKRSGQHGVINWMKSQTDLPHHNNVCFGWKNKELRPMSDKSKIIGGDAICNIEDFDLDDYNEYGFGDFEFMKTAKVVIIIRDPLNWLASCYKRKNAPIRDHQDVYRALAARYTNDSKVEKPGRLELYHKYVKLWKHEKRYLDRLPVFVNFNAWFKSKTYREKLAQLLGFNFTDGGLNAVNRVGNGSSFDGTKFHGKAQEMDVLNRWVQFKDDEEFKSYLDDDLLEFSKKEFDICFQ